MDQQRRNFISFLLLTLAAFLLANVLFPPAPPPKKAAPIADAPQQPADEPVAQLDDEVAAESDEPEDDPALAPQPAAEVPQQFVTLGSLDDSSGFRMLVTLTNTGAAVRRAELSNRRYRDEDIRSGYLGSLELTPVEGGLEVQVVGEGTPAEESDIQKGDVVVGVGPQEKLRPITSVDDFRSVLSKTEPGDRLTLHVRRGDAAPQSVVLKLIRRPFAVLRPEIENYWMRDEAPPAVFVDRPSFQLALAAVGGKKLEGEEIKRIAAMVEQGQVVSPAERELLELSKRITALLEQSNWQVDRQSETSVEFTKPLPEFGLVLVKRFTLDRAPPAEIKNSDYPGYDLRLDVELRNTGERAQQVAYRLDGPTGMPLEGWWYAHKISQQWFSSGGLRDVAVRFFGSQTALIEPVQISEGDVDAMGAEQPLAYAGVDGQYFSAILIPVRETADDVWFDTIEALVVGPKPAERMPKTFTNVTCRMTHKLIELPAGATHSESFQIFIGPKRPDLLARYDAAGDPDYSLRDLIYYGWPIFRSVARTMTSILHFFYGIVDNYGIAIILLTVLVRGAMFPISFKQTQNMARLQELKPEMDKINEKYKTDLQKRSQAMQELYRKHNINPLGGCLPLFIQLPIFIGLYKALMVDVELRGSPLISEAVRWCSNLAAPDMFLDWSWMMPDWIESGQGIFALGPYLNILPIVTVALFLVTQKLAMPAPTTEQAALQQKMMKYMTLFMGILFYKVASGLCIYFIASSLWGIAERKLLPKHKSADEAAASGPAGGAPPSRGDRPGGGPKAGPKAGPKPGPNGTPRKRQPKKVKRKR